jgi:hypothetical protein
VATVQIELLTQDDAARLLHKQRRTLEDWRYRGFGPRYVMVGRSVFYAPDDLAAWLESRKVSSTAEATMKGQVRRPRERPAVEGATPIAAAPSIPPARRRRNGR